MRVTMRAEFFGSALNGAPAGERAGAIDEKPQPPAGLCEDRTGAGMFLRTVAVSVAFFLAATAFGQLTYITQNRSVSATGPGGGTPSSASAPDFSAFNTTVNSNGPSGGVATASQNTSLLPLSISAQGSAQGGKNASNQFGSASSVCIIRFKPLNNTTFTCSLLGIYTSATISGPGVGLTLVPFDEKTGVFQAGESYILNVNAAGVVASGQAQQGAFALTLTLTGVASEPQTEAFTYQGVLKDGGAPLDGVADFLYTLYPAPEGAFEFGPPLEFLATSVQRGVFTHRLDFGDVFTGEERWLEVAVRSPAGSGNYTPIGPRTRIESTPYASYALQAGGAPWSGIAGVPSNVSNAFSPWQSVAGGIAYTGSVAIGTDAISADHNLLVREAANARILVQSDSTSYAGVRTKNTNADYFMGLNGPSEWQLYDNSASAARLRVRSNGNVAVGDFLAEQRLSVDGTIQVVTGNQRFLAFGGVGNTLGTAENTDLIGFQRVNINSGATNSSELRLIIGDDNVPGPSVDFFSIGTIPGGNWNATFGFRTDGLASKPGGGSWASISDPRTKHDVSPLKGTLDRLLSLRGYQYFYNDVEVMNGRALPGLQIGLMADEVERVFPDWVSRDKDGMRMVTERSTTALMVEALRDLREEKDRQIEIQNKEIEELKARLEKLERAIRGSK